MTREKTTTTIETGSTKTTVQTEKSARIHLLMFMYVKEILRFVFILPKFIYINTTVVGTFAVKFVRWHEISLKPIYE